MPPPAASPLTRAVSPPVLDSFRPGLPCSSQLTRPSACVLACIGISCPFCVPLLPSGFARILGFDLVSFCSCKRDYYRRVGSFPGGWFSLVWSSRALVSTLLFFSFAGPAMFRFLLSFRGASSLSGLV
ncbi:hypothetical protein U1Q18_047631 [Sarracenia purpurea var. burkii]